MKKITDKQFANYYRSANLWFVALYMEAFIIRYDELTDKLTKTKLVEEIYDNGEGPDANITGTRTRVNALHNIVASGRIEEALEVVVGSRIEKQFPDAYNEAKDLLFRIRTGKFKIPDSIYND